MISPCLYLHSQTFHSIFSLLSSYGGEGYRGALVRAWHPARVKPLQMPHALVPKAGERGQDQHNPGHCQGQGHCLLPSEVMMAPLEDKPTFIILPNVCSRQPSSSHINGRGIRKPCIHLTLLLLICSLPASTFALIFIKHHTRGIQTSLCGAQNPVTG